MIQLITVGDLIKALLKFKSTATVWMEDSDGNIYRASGVQKRRGSSEVVITNGAGDGLNPCTDVWIDNKRGAKSGPGTRRGDLRTGHWMNAYTKK